MYHIYMRDLRLSYVHLFENISKQDVARASLIYKGLLDDGVDYFDTNSHWIICTGQLT